MDLRIGEVLTNTDLDRTIFERNRPFVYQERSQKGDSGCASEKLGVPHLLSD